MGKKWERFQHLDEGEYRREICQMSQEQLRREHKIIQQNIVSASAAAGASVAAGFFTFGIAWAGTAVAGRRINVNSRQCTIIENRLKEMEWEGHEFRKRDFAYSAGPCFAAELLVPAGGALLGHAGQVATQHATSTASQHALQAASQHATQITTQHAAQNLAVHHPIDAASSVCHHASTFAHAAAQGAEGQVFTLTHGLIGHATANAFQMYPPDLATAQATLLGQAAGQAASVKGGKYLAKKAIRMTTKFSIRKAIESKEKNAKRDANNVEGDDDDDTKMTDLIHSAAKSLLDNFYKNMANYDRDGKIKDDIQKVDSCDTVNCSCTDYDDQKQSLASTNNDTPTCRCGHRWGGHSRRGNNASIIQKFCETWYPRLDNRNYDGTLKMNISDIERCSVADCLCGDYNRAPDSVKTFKDCKCGHGWNLHNKNNSDTDEKRAWIMNVVSVIYLRHVVPSE